MEAVKYTCMTGQYMYAYGVVGGHVYPGLSPTTQLRSILTPGV